MRRAEITSHAFAFFVVAVVLVSSVVEKRGDAAWAKRPSAVAIGSDEERAEAGPPPLPERRPDPMVPARIPPTAPEITKAGPAAAGEAPSTAVSPTSAPSAPPADWSDVEKIEALTRCVSRLAPLGVRLAPPRSIRQDTCGGPALVEIESFEIDGSEVALRPRLLVNCEMAARLHQFIVHDLQPLARAVLDSPIARIENVGGYQCRGVVGTSSTRGFSEHAFANAVDMGTFVTADGRRISVRDDWGPTARDVHARVKASTPGQDKPPSSAPSSGGHAGGEADDSEAGPPPLPVRNPLLVAATVRRGERGRRIRIASEAPTPAGAPTLTPAADAPLVARTFLKRLHAAGCRRFSTALGPEANEAHRDHFHFDLAQRRSGRSYCE